eukprot:CAMPEP_0185911266 /NCGR_PEP_ID=MMETSP0196C-20130402/26857_1 /TAXON_ID=2932 /ORGANISM="Alexandrium fundyense, Strain CCMP1719" /LENGTH=46 /DNA_ID= /DNA_START= /DNA_END= /DNA_ORIENTATION=
MTSTAYTACTAQAISTACSAELRIQALHPTQAYFGSPAFSCSIALC